MEQKKNLNNTQRKMLDDLYLSRFNAKRRAVLDERANQSKKLEAAIVVKEAKKYRELIRIGSKYFQLCKELRLQLENDGLELQSCLSSEPCLRLSSYRGQHPDMVEFRKATAVIEESFADKAALLRARIYGVDTSYTEIEADIEKALSEF